MALQVAAKLAASELLPQTYICFVTASFETHSIQEYLLISLSNPIFKTIELFHFFIKGYEHIMLISSALTYNLWCFYTLHIRKFWSSAFFSLLNLHLFSDFFPVLLASHPQALYKSCRCPLRGFLFLLFPHGPEVSWCISAVTRLLLGELEVSLGPPGSSVWDIVPSGIFQSLIFM